MLFFTDNSVIVSISVLSVPSTGNNSTSYIREYSYLVTCRYIYLNLTLKRRVCRISMQNMELLYPSNIEDHKALYHVVFNCQTPYKPPSSTINRTELLNGGRALTIPSSINHPHLTITHSSSHGFLKYWKNNSIDLMHKS